MRTFGLILLCLLACGLFVEQAQARYPRVRRAYVVGRPVRAAYYAPVVPVVPVVRPYYYGPAYGVVPGYGAVPAMYGGPSPLIHPPVYGGYIPYGW